MASKNRLAEDRALEAQLVQFFSQKHMSFYRTKSVAAKELKEMKARAKALVRESSKNHTLRAIADAEKIIAIVLRARSENPRVKNQQSIYSFFEPKRKKDVLSWVQYQVHEAGLKAPRFTQLGILPDEDPVYREPIEQAGFNIRYEVLQGETKKALAGLLRKRNPKRDLEHLGLAIKPVALKSELRSVMALQKKVSLQAKSHTYFGHSREQLAKDKKDYERIIKTGEGLILGVYKKDRLLGLMIGGLHQEASLSEKLGGFSFFLDKSIQGKGVVKTGYRLLLEYFVKNGIKHFHGGTSQPAVQGLGKVMKRKVLFVIYLKMK